MVTSTDASLLFNCLSKFNLVSQGQYFISLNTSWVTNTVLMFTTSWQKRIIHSLSTLDWKYIFRTLMEYGANGICMAQG